MGGANNGRRTTTRTSDRRSARAPGADATNNDAADLADAPDIGELRRFVGAELPWMPAHAEAKWDVVAEEDFLNFAVQENLRTITVNQLMSWYVDRALVYGGFGPGAEAAFREFAKGKLSDAHVEKLIAWGRVIHSEET